MLIILLTTYRFCIYLFLYKKLYLIYVQERLHANTNRNVNI